MSDLTIPQWTLLRGMPGKSSVDLQLHGWHPQIFKSADAKHADKEQPVYLTENYLCMLYPHLIHQDFLCVCVFVKETDRPKGLSLFLILP